MRIAIVDDDLIFAEKIERVVKDFFGGKQENCDIKIFNNGLSLLNELEENRNYDLYFINAYYINGNYLNSL